MRQIRASCRSTGRNALLLSGQRSRGDFGAWRGEAGKRLLSFRHAHPCPWHQRMSTVGACMKKTFEDVKGDYEKIY